MSHVFVTTLIANPAQPHVTPELIEKVKTLIGADKVDILHPGVAADLYCTFSAKTEVIGKMKARAISSELGPVPVDVVVQGLAERRKMLLLADMDSTMIGQECIDELAAYVGKKDHVAAITERAMRGEIEFEPALRERVALLAGLDAGVVDQVIETRITLTPGGKELVRTMRANGAYTALVSGGFTVFTSRIAEMIGFDENRANHLDLANGQFAGTVQEPILGKQAKLNTLRELRYGRELSRLATMAVGDGANDLAMIDEAGLGVAFHAKPAVAEQAAARIDHGDLTALLYLQGYHFDEFVRR